MRDGQVLDEITSYTALRSVDILRDRFMLNGRPYMLRLVLDQGYWPETLLAAPSDEALRQDVELAKAMGFNGVRKHQKIEDPRYLYWADRLGLLVWEEMPSAYRFTRGAINRIVREWTEAIARDYSHPCIIVWVPFNESWGVPELTSRRAQRDAVQALYHLTRTLDPTGRSSATTAGSRARPTSSASTTTTRTPTTCASATPAKAPPTSCSTGAAQVAGFSRSTVIRTGGNPSC